MDEHVELLKNRGDRECGRGSTRLLIALPSVLMLLVLGGCPLTNVALVSVSNETPAHLQVRSRLRGNATFAGAMDLAPTEEKPLLKYEEGWFTVEPIAKLVLGLDLVASTGCVARLENGALTRASTRDPDAPLWTVHLRPEDLPGIQCPPGTPPSPPSAPTAPPVRTTVPGAAAVPPAPPSPGSVTPPPHVPPAPPPAREEKQIKN